MRIEHPAKGMLDDSQTRERKDQEEEEGVAAKLLGGRLQAAESTNTSKHMHYM